MPRLKLRNLLKPRNGRRDNLLTRIGALLKGLLSLPKWLMTAVSIGIILLILALLLGCAKRVVKVRPLLPPQSAPRPIPSYQGQTYRDVIQHAIDLRRVAEACEIDKGVWRAMTPRDELQ